MQLPTIDRIPSQRPVATEAAALSTGRVIPVPPVNTASTGVQEPEPQPSVINLINTAHKPVDGEVAATSVTEPSRPGNQTSDLDKAWTARQPAVDVVQEPAKPPLFEMLINHIKSLWEASASAVQVQQQVKDQLEPKAVPDPGKGSLSTEVFTYSPTKITKTEKAQN